jgi:hypothetical protein
LFNTQKQAMDAVDAKLDGVMKRAGL